MAKKMRTVICLIVKNGEYYFSMYFFSIAFEAMAMAGSDKLKAD